MELFAPTHLLIIAFIVLLLFGGKKLPELARSVGESMQELRKGVSGAAVTEVSTNESAKSDS